MGSEIIVVVGFIDASDVVGEVCLDDGSELNGGNFFPDGLLVGNADSSDDGNGEG